MKHYEKLLELGCFSKNDLEQITGSEAAAKWLCREYRITARSSFMVTAIRSFTKRK